MSGRASRQVRGCLALLVVCAAVAVWFVLPRSPGDGSIFDRYARSHFLLAVLTTYLCVGIALVLVSGGHRSRVFALLAVSLGLAFSVAALEIPAILGLVDYRILFGTPAPRGWDNPRNRLDPELLHIHIPHSEYASNEKGDLVDWFGISTERRYAVDVRYDQNGFRNPVDRMAAEVVVIGDSFVEGPSVAQEELLSTRLEDVLGVPVLNLGQSGYGPQQQEAVLRRFGLPARPRLVVWVLFEGNDLVHDFSRYRQMIADWADTSMAVRGASMRSWTRNLLMLLSRWSSPIERDPGLAERRAGTLSSATSPSGETMYFAYELRALTEPDWAAMGAALLPIAEAHRLSVEAGARFLVAFAPVKFRVYHDLCTFAPDSDPASWVVNDLPQRVAGWARGNGIPFLDLTPALRERARAAGPVFFLDDGHWNGAGHDVAAEQISKWAQGR